MIQGLIRLSNERETTCATSSWIVPHLANYLLIISRTKFSIVLALHTPICHIIRTWSCGCPITGVWFELFVIGYPCDRTSITRTLMASVAMFCTVFCQWCQSWQVAAGNGVSCLWQQWSLNVKTGSRNFHSTIHKRWSQWLNSVLKTLPLLLIA